MVASGAFVAFRHRPQSGASVSFVVPIDRREVRPRKLAAMVMKSLKDPAVHFSS